MTIMTKYEAKNDPKVLSHADWLWDLSKDKILDTNTRKRLQSISVLLKNRPEINVAEDFVFEVGETYLTVGGELIEITARSTTYGYECAIGEDGVARYNRSTTTADIGRVTGTDGTDPRNLIPLKVWAKKRVEPDTTAPTMASEPAPKATHRVKAGGFNRLGYFVVQSSEGFTARGFYVDEPDLTVTMSMMSLESV